MGVVEKKKEKKAVAGTKIRKAKLFFFVPILQDFANYFRRKRKEKAQKIK